MIPVMRKPVAIRIIQIIDLYHFHINSMYVCLEKPIGQYGPVRAYA